MTTKFANYAEASHWFERVFLTAARIVEGDCWRWVKQPNGLEDYVHTYEGRRWFRRERNKYRLHPAVEAIMAMYRPDNWQLLLLEWPHRSATDPNRLAYTRDERAGEADRQVITTIGKYLHRHFSHAPDDMIRDIVAQYSYDGKIVIVRDIDAMVKAVTEGPGSCMSKDFDIRCDDGKRRHPYAVYDPELGWGMVVRTDSDGSILGRCLVWECESDGTKCFVRSYKRERDQCSHSGRDEAIDSYLRNLGYELRSSWPDGTPVLRIPTADGYLMPYIDGGRQSVDNHDTKDDLFVITENGAISCNETSGVVNDGDSTCEDCGRRFSSENEGIWIGVWEDYHVCGNCEDEYTYAYSRRGNQYYIPNDRVVEVSGEYYDSEYLSDNNIVELANGDYEHFDNAVWIESTDEYYHVDDYDICFAEDTSQYEMRHNCWQCKESGNWYTDEEESVEIDGELYHPDHAPEPETTDDNNTETN